jgi:hypothetical protein
LPRPRGFKGIAPPEQTFEVRREAPTCTLTKSSHIDAVNAHFIQPNGRFPELEPVSAQPQNGGGRGRKLPHGRQPAAGEVDDFAGLA